LLEQRVFQLRHVGLKKGAPGGFLQIAIPLDAALPSWFNAPFFILFNHPMVCSVDACGSHSAPPCHGDSCAESAAPRL